jgi:hypothetical protein
VEVRCLPLKRFLLEFLILVASKGKYAITTALAIISNNEF